MTSFKDSSHAFAAERRAYLGKRPGFQIDELRLCADQSVPRHYHTHIQDTFYVIEGRVRIHLKDPEEQVVLGPAETYSVRPQRPHRVTNDTTSSTTFYDFVTLED